MAESHERECAVCTNDLTTPKILPCGHVLCRECVITWMDSKPDAWCPLCRCPIVEQSDGSSSDTVDALPTDFVMEALVESARVLSKDHLCCVCEDVRADFICMQCQVMLCSSCTKVHSKLPATRSHDVESVSTVTPERLAASRPALCADHGDKHAEYFCREHRLAFCSACKTNKHKVCLEVNYLEDEIKSAQNSLTNLTKNLVEAEQKLEQAIGQVTSRLQEVDVSEQEDMAQVDKSCGRLQKLVEDVCKELKDKCRKPHLKIRKSLCDIKTGLCNRLVKVTSHKHIVTRVTALSQRPALIHMTQAVRDRVNSLDLSADLHQVVWVKPLSHGECCQEVVRRIENVVRMWKQEQIVSELVSQPPVLVFHDNCGSNIRLTNGNRTAEKIDRSAYNNGVVMSRDPMLFDVLYEVRVDAARGGYNELIVGVTRSSPAHVFVTKYASDLPDSVIIGPGEVSYQQTCVQIPLGVDLKRLDVGSRVGLLVTSSNDLHLYIDGQDEGVVAKNVTQPWFAVFAIGGSVHKVTALPISWRT
ncbi:E3 ubiquitin-protein ligase TRIM33-like isoform X2 [Pomacea canaliculata]|uniref:E3 ubiquitin-protein ligase TRIM33-like isoform X2 n=1 Tax=Pomacea canaliculata TaxID=400727 RepID=UPI000D7368DF|nr:E3 ubiquitin-protein ligase TRIM33-like isoform X2 [Pomacea canaliculata]